MTYRFNIEERGNGAIVATCGEFTASSERGLARMLVEAGRPDGEVEAGREGRADWHVASLHRFAAVAMTEGEKGFAFPLYKPFPVRDLHPALDRAIADLAGARRAASDVKAARVVAKKAQKALAVAP